MALLVVTPSKSDRERIIPMSAELFHVVAQVIRRHRNEHGTVPVCVRYDSHERTWSEPLPYLFQNFHGGTQRGMASITVWRLIGRACDELALKYAQFKDIRFAPHDFRRLFATELVNNGLPIHIGAALLGHLDIRTTRGYVAVFDEDVISNYHQFLARRRAERPKEEYRDPPRRSGPTSRNTSTSAASSSAPAAGPTEPPAHTSTPASAARWSASTPRCCPASTRSRRTSWHAASGPSPRTGRARSKE
ncbi:tyrosine-type recombinase/integrase [Streptomyces clavifer]|uniref:tyrosine-type recombinase/integrase n=1 Tax=Streptomyces clavifer TaxID=68188 RepID=UPI0033250A50